MYTQTGESTVNLTKKVQDSKCHLSKSSIFTGKKELVDFGNIPPAMLVMA